MTYVIDERDYRREPDAQDHRELAEMRSRWQIGERVRITDKAWDMTLIHLGGFDPQWGRDGVISSIDFRHHGGCGFFPMIWVQIDNDPDGPMEWDEEDLERS